MKESNSKTANIVKWIFGTLIVVILGFKWYVKNETEDIDWNELKEKYEQDEIDRQKAKAEIKEDKGSPFGENNYFKSIKDLVILLPKEWRIKQEIHETDFVEYFHVLFMNSKDERVISISSQRPQEYLESLSEMAVYQNERIVRNLKPTGIVLVSDKTERKKFKNADAVFEYFTESSEYNSNDQKYLAINFIHKEFLYTIFHAIEPHSEKIIETVGLR